jgi:hypothetical protein
LEKLVIKISQLSNLQHQDVGAGERVIVEEDSTPWLMLAMPLLVFFTNNSHELLNSAIVGVLPAIVGVFHQQFTRVAQFSHCWCFSPTIETLIVFSSTRRTSCPIQPLLVFFTNNSHELPHD